ncbi:MAG: LysE family transporter [Bacteroidetes bacterium]|nr:LysE family transporter [Bacteroidota bacterium]
MPKMLRILFWGLLISFLGSLPLGTLNVAAMQIGIAEGYYYAMLFSIGSLLVEMIYVRISLVGISWIQKQVKLMKIMEWITLAIIVLLAIGSFYAAIHSSGEKQVHIWDKININRFLLGAGMCAINPVQIPFWFGWSTVLFSKKILEPVNAQYNSYIIGIGLGTLAGNCVFIFGGKLMVEKISGSQDYINWVIGAVFAITAVIQLWKIITHKDAVDKIQHIHPDENLKMN